MRYYPLFIVSLPLAVGLCAITQTPAGSAPITALPMSSVYTPPLPLKRTAYELIASWYGSTFTGRPTTSGERFDPHRLTAASITMPLGSVVKAENPKNGRSVKVRINDCGPYVLGRGLDISLGAPRKIGIDRQGVARLKVTPIKIPRHADLYRCCE